MTGGGGGNRDDKKKKTEAGQKAYRLAAQAAAQGGLGPSFSMNEQTPQSGVGAIVHEILATKGRLTIALLQALFQAK